VGEVAEGIVSGYLRWVDDGDMREIDGFGQQDADWTRINGSGERGERVTLSGSRSSQKSAASCPSTPPKSKKAEGFNSSTSFTVN